MQKIHRRSAGDQEARIGACQTRDNQFSSGVRCVGARVLTRRSNSCGWGQPPLQAQKFLARDATRSQARSAMSTFASSTNHGRAFVGILLSVGFLWVLALSASPQLHQRVHPDASRTEHNCAATMIASGSYDHVAHVPLVSASVLAHPFSKIPALTPHWVESPFLGARIFEHAPPARG
jgi:hypothetical protein